ncbi:MULTISPECIES: VOC family protein [Paenibacillus]|uniref:VOC family protein n=1 Tax=Paenibacillus TaxID=44249 RepID=UPI0022B90674|nr:VOC family protein [Paenibacillus caseinilyticus]MCZ8519955.1 VOC family protein [Paenibacillus caseinilyticus]
MKTGHVGLNVTELNRSVDFYVSVFGFQVKHRSDEEERAFALLGDDSGLILTLWQQSGGVFDTGRPGLHHLAFEAASIEQIRGIEDRLRAEEVPLIYDGVVLHGESSASGGIFFLDPDGIRLEIYAPEGVNGHQHAKAEGPACGFF